MGTICPGCSQDESECRCEGVVINTAGSGKLALSGGVKMDNKIEEVKKILLRYRSRMGLTKHDTVEKYARQICQLFSQPLDSEELREKIAKMLLAHDSSRGYGAETEIGIHYPTWRQLHEIAREEYREDAGDILALLQPKIEEAKREERRMCCGILAGCPWKQHKDDSISIRMDRKSYNELFDEQALKGGE